MGIVLLSVVIMALGLIAPQLVQAESHVASPSAQWVVNTAIDENDGSCSDGDCTLHDAIAVAANGDTITFAGDYTIYLSDTLYIAKTLTIDGNGHAITVSGDTAGDGSPDVQVFYIDSGDVVTLTHLNIISGTGSWGGGVLNWGSTVTIQNSTLSGNSASQYGGGIYNRNGTLTLQNSTLSGNSTSQYGGGIYKNGGTLTVKNSTLSGNSAGTNGGGILNYTGTFTVQNSTLAYNSSIYGGGIYNQGSLNLYNTIIAHHPAGGDCYSNGGTFGTNDHNLISNVGSYACGLRNNDGGSLIGVDPWLGPLANNGGGTLTHALLSGSPAIEGGNNSICLSTDQRGVARPQMTRCDIGAYEASPQPVIRLSKSVTPTLNIPIEGVVTYTLIMKNVGVVEPQGQLTDTMPDGLAFKQWVRQPEGAVVNGSAITWTGVLSTNVPLTLTFQVTRTMLAWSDWLVNTAYFSGTAHTITASAAFSVTCVPFATVKNANDTGPGSLRLALVSTCAGGRIIFSGDTNISLLSQLPIDRSVTIDGSGHTITLNGNYAVRVFSIGSSSTVTLSHLNIINGHTSSGGGIDNQGTLVLQNSTLSGNTASGNGGGIANSSTGTLTVQNSTLSGNAASGNGGGIVNAGTLRVENSTLSGNQANWGGGIYSDGSAYYTATVSLLNSTLSDNGAYNTIGGLFNAGYSQLQYWNTIIANSLRGGDCVNKGTIVTNVNNLVEDGSCGANGVNFLSGDPWLGVLANNGGGTLTHALLSGSPAIESGDDATCLATDQRGVARPQMTQCDIGAYEAPPQIVVRLTKSVTPTLNIPVNSVVTYTLAPHNVGSVAEAQGQLTDTLPYGVEFKQWVTQPSGAVVNGSTITWTGALAANAPLTITFQATRTAAAWGNPIVNTAYFSGTAHTATVSAAFNPECTPALTVYNLNDSGPGSLRQAITGVCSDGLVNFDPALSGQTITLSSQLQISRSLTIDGRGLGIPITLNGNDTVRIFRVSNNARVTLESLTLTRGKITYAGSGGSWTSGGALEVDGGAAVTLTQSSVLSSTVGEAEGGAILNRGFLTIVSSTLASNNSTGHAGLEVFCESSCATQIVSSTFSQSVVSIDNDLITLLVQNSLFSDNSGISVNSGAATVQNSTFINNSAGLYVNYCSSTTCLVTVSNSTFARNRVGISNENSKLILQNNTFSGNGRGLLNSAGSVLSYTNTIIANSTAYSDCTNNGTLAMNVNNLVEDGSCSTGGVNFQTGDPNLGSLADQGGPPIARGQPLPMFSLLPGSKAINTGSNTRCLATDQRGQPRNDGQCDRGAYERGPLRLINSVTPAVNAPYHGLVTYTLVLSNAGGMTEPNVWLTDPVPAGFTFERWVVSPTQTTLTDNVIGWQGVLTNGTTLTWTFQARNSGDYGLPADYGDTVINVARAGGTSDVGIRIETALLMECGNLLMVQNLKNDGTCSLRAVAAAAAPGSTVVFRPQLAGQTILLSLTLVITKDLIVDAGSLATPLTLNGNQAVRVIQVPANNRVTLNGLTLTFGKIPPGGMGGGGLLVESGASVTLTHSTIYSNTAAEGGGIYNLGTLLLRHSAILNNLANASGGGAGGGIYNQGGTLIIQNSIISGNAGSVGSNLGGGIAQWSGVLIIQNSTISGNSNAAGGGISLYGSPTLPSSLLMINSTVSGNSGNMDGGGIYSIRSTDTLINSTLLDNYTPPEYDGSRSGYRGERGSVDFRNTVIASQWGIDCGFFLDQVISANINNFVGDGTCSDNGVNFSSGDPLLGPLADNGGDTLTHALLPGSPLVDAGDAAACPATDQRGVPRPQGAACDIGAYEARINLALTKSVTPTLKVPYHGTLTYTLVLSNAGELSEPDMLLTDTLPSSVAFGAWLAQPTGTIIHAGDTLTWTGALNAQTALTFVFTATHVGLPREWVTNTAYFSGTTGAGSASAGFPMTAYIITPTAGIGGSITPSTAQVINPGEDRVFTIAPNYGYHILDVGVDGVSVGVMNVYTFTSVMADHTISATFDLNAYALTTNVIGQGQITRTPDQATYLYGSSVTLTALPQPGWYFGQWLGDASGTLTQTTVLMDANKVVTATFSNTPPTYYTLTLSLIGSGVITPTAGAHTYLSGTGVPLSASPTEGWLFVGWTGNADCADGSVTMNANKLCTATFARYQVYLPLILR